MKRFLTKSIFYLLPIVLCFVIGEIVLRNIPNDYSFKNDYLSKNCKRIEILILGNSTAIDGFNSNLFYLKAFNAAHHGQSIRYDKFIFDKFFDSLTSLKYVILPVSYSSLHFDLTESLKHNIKNYNIYYGCNYHKELKYNIEMANMTSYTWDKVWNAITNRDYSFVNVDSLGFNETFIKDRVMDLDSSGVEISGWHTVKNVDSVMVSDNEKMITDLIKKCRNKNIKVFVVTPPNWHTYSENADVEHFEYVKSFCYNLSLEFPNVKFFDFSDDKRFVDEDFLDAIHLSGIGANKLTRIIDSIMIDDVDNYE